MYANQHQGSTEIQFGAWTLSLKSQTITDGQVSRELEPLVYGLLLYLLENHDRIVSKAELTDFVWRQKHVDDNAINRAFSVLRKTLKSAKQPGVVVKTHYRKGYSIIVPVNFVSQEPEPNEPEGDPAKNAAAEQVNADSLQEGEQSLSKRANFNLKRWSILAIGFVLLIILVMLYPSSDLPKATYEEHQQGEILTWRAGRVVVPVLNSTEALLAFSYAPEGDDDDWLSVKSLRTNKVVDVFKPSIEGDEAYALAFSQANELYFQVVNYRKQARCEIWKANLGDDKLLNVESIVTQKLFDCQSSNIMSGTVVNHGQTLIYVKHYYQGVRFSGRLVSRNLQTGEESQISTPAFNTLGDYYVVANPQKDRIAFVRSSGGIYSVISAKLDGSDIQVFASSEQFISFIQWSEDGQQIFWLKAAEPAQIVTIDVSTGERTAQNLALSDAAKFPSFNYSSALFRDQRIILASAGREGSIRPFVIENNQLVEQKISDLPWPEEYGNAFNEPEHYLFVTHYKGHTAWLYANEVAQKIGSLPDNTIGVKLSPSEQHFAALVMDSPNAPHFEVYSLEPFKQVSSIVLQQGIHHFAWLNDNTLLMGITNADEHIELWRYQLDSQKLINEQQPCLCKFGLQVNEGKVYSLSRKSELFLHDLQQNTQQAFEHIRNDAYTRFKVQGNLVALDYNMTDVVITDLNNQQPKITLPISSDMAIVDILSFKDNRLLLQVTKSKNNNFYLFDPKNL